MNQTERELFHEMRNDIKQLLAFRNKLIGIVIVVSGLSSGLWTIVIAWITHKPK